MPLAEFAQLVLASFDEACTHRGRCAEQVEQEPCAAPEVADEREIRFVRFAETRNRPDRVGQGKVVVDTGNHLHAPAIAVRQACAVHRLHAPDVGAAIAADRNGVIGGQPARHARAPHHFVAERAIDNLVDPGEFLEAGLDAGVHAGDQLELRLTEISGDVRMGQRRAERQRVRGHRELALGAHAQALLLDAAANALQYGGRKSAQAFLDLVQAAVPRREERSKVTEGRIRLVAPGLNVPTCRALR